MATLGLVEYADASPEVRAVCLVEYADASNEVSAVYDDIMAVRQTDWINNFWKALANDPGTLRRTWESIKEIMAPGALHPLTKELIYLAVSTTNQCGYCIASHTAGARKAGMTDQMFAELMAVVGMANQTNRMVSGYQVEIDERFRQKPAQAPDPSPQLPQNKPPHDDAGRSRPLRGRAPKKPAQAPDPSPQLPQNKPPHDDAGRSRPLRGRAPKK